MLNFEFFTDTACDLTPELIQECEVSLIPLCAASENEVCDGVPDENGEKIKAFYASLRSGSVYKTSAANIAELDGYWRRPLESGRDVLYLCFSSALSSTYSTANMLSAQLMEEFPGRKVYIVDTRCASMGQGLLVYLAAKRAAEGAGIDEVRDFAEELKLSVCHRFTVDDLMFLKRGGRLSAASAVMGTVLNIKPVMHVDNEGRLVPTEKVKGRKASVKRLYTLMQETFEPERCKTVFISHGDCEEDANSLAAMIREGLGVEDIHIYYIGPTVGSHSGPGTLALFFIGKER